MNKRNFGTVRWHYDNHYALCFHTALNAPTETGLSAFSVIAACSGIDIRDDDGFCCILYKSLDGGQLSGPMGLVLAITKVLHTKFGNTKIVFDVTLVLIAAVFSFVFLGKITGVREGTLAAALLVGQISKLCLKHYGRLGKWINAAEE
jgi:hypothetical protein